MQRRTSITLELRSKHEGAAERKNGKCVQSSRVRERRGDQRHGRVTVLWPLLGFFFMPDHAGLRVGETAAESVEGVPLVDEVGRALSHTPAPATRTPPAPARKRYQAVQPAAGAVKAAEAAGENPQRNPRNSSSMNRGSASPSWMLAAEATAPRP
jgi:hypothetical protein